MSKAAAAVVLSLAFGSPAWAYRASLSTVSLPPSGPVLVEMCQGSTEGPPGAYAGGWFCSPGGHSGSDPFVQHADAHVAASADLRDGSMRLAADASGSAGVGLGDMLWLTVPGLGAGQTRTLSFELVVDGSYARAPGQDRGQANFSFQAVSGLFSDALTDQVSGSVAWRTAPGSDIVNTTDAPEEFHRLGATGDWVELATHRFVATLDVSGDDPTLGFSMNLWAAGPADFSHTASVRLTLPSGASFASESGVFLSAVPEPSAAALLGLGLVGLLGWRRRG